LSSAGAQSRHVGRAVIGESICTDTVMVTALAITRIRMIPREHARTLPALAQGLGGLPFAISPMLRLHGRPNEPRNGPGNPVLCPPLHAPSYPIHHPVLSLHFASCPLQAVTVMTWTCSLWIENANTLHYVSISNYHLPNRPKKKKKKKNTTPSTDTSGLGCGNG
jgi:hypothetical protein